MTIKYYTRFQFGNYRNFMLESPEANAVKTLTRRGTLDADDLLALQALGVVCEPVADPASSGALVGSGTGDTAASSVAESTLS